MRQKVFSSRRIFFLLRDRHLDGRSTTARTRRGEMGKTNHDGGVFNWLLLVFFSVSITFFCSSRSDCTRHASKGWKRLDDEKTLSEVE